MTSEEEFNCFLEKFAPVVETKTKQLHQALWLLETVGSEDAQSLQASLSAELKSLYSNEDIYKKLKVFKDSDEIDSPIKKRILDVLLFSFEENMLPADLLRNISEKEADLARSYSSFRPLFEEKECTENDILDVLKHENSVERRNAAWETSKEIGNVLAPKILEIIRLRNQSAHRLGYSDYFTMQLKLQETDPSWLKKIFDEFQEKSSEAYNTVFQEIETNLMEKYNVQKSALGPWAWSEPFGQEDPLSASELDDLVKGVDIISVSKEFFKSISLPIGDILKKSDLYERNHKNQHAFCISIDRYKDVRVLTNLRPTAKWLETMLHELGHTVYDLNYDPKLPWLLRIPPHMITTEAMALVSGRLAYEKDFLQALHPEKEELEELIEKSVKSLKRRQLIFSRWVLVMFNFEKSLYANPDQDLNKLWWSYVQQYQKITPPPGRNDKNDWAAKYHIGLAPVYYHSYLLGEFFASMIKDSLKFHTSKPSLMSGPQVGNFLKERLFNPGNSIRWDTLVEKVCDEPLKVDSWINEFSI